MIGIVDYGLSNIRSVVCALQKIEIDCKVVENPKNFKNFSGFILPGVGAFNEAMKNIEEKGIDDEIKNEVLNKKKKILGICLGMQLLADQSEENGITNGLGLIKGKVKKIKKKNIVLPHMGWNKTEILSKNKIFSNIPDIIYLYYVHSYCLHPNDSKSVLAKTKYGEPINSIVSNDNIFGIQPHPEKSQFFGLCFLKNFCEL